MTENAATDHACVLIVDDEESVRESLRDVVELMGCSAILADAAPAALEILKTQHPCLVILDLLMPGMTGLEMLEAMRADASLDPVQVVISTSAPERAPRGVPIMPKPIDVAAFCGWMKRTCRCVP